MLGVRFSYMASGGPWTCVELGAARSRVLIFAWQGHTHKSAIACEPLPGPACSKAQDDYAKPKMRCSSRCQTDPMLLWRDTQPPHTLAPLTSKVSMPALFYPMS